MRGGRELRLVEVELPRRQLTLELSTSRILDAAGAPCGAVMLLDDPTPRHKLHRERQASQTLDLLNRVLLRLTDEIKNPLVSIYTFLELLPHRYEDPEFRETFLSVVGKDTQRLISLVDKLITLAGDRDYKVGLLRSPAAPARRAGGALGPPGAVEGAERRRAVPAPGPGAGRAADRDPLRARRTGLVVKADREQLTKAIGYLVRFLANRVDARRARGHPPADVAGGPGAECACRSTGRPAQLSTLEREHLFSPLAIASDKLLDVGPGVTQKIVEAHGGTLTLGGQEGEIRFVLTLPRTHQ